MRSTWGPEADALTHIAAVVGGAGKARQEYLEAARDGKFEVRAKPHLMDHHREPIPREEWFRCVWLELPDRLSTGFHFLGHGERGWFDREVRWADIEAFWPALDSLSGRDKRQAAVAAAVTRGVRLENTPGGWKAIGGLIRGDCHARDDARFFSDKAIERDFKEELKQQAK